MMRDLLRIARELRTLWKSFMVTLPYLHNRQEQRRCVTEQYPDPVSSRTEEDLPAKTRGLLFNDIDRCTGCGDCVSACPVKCIDLEATEVTADKKRWVGVFDIDFGKCVFCGDCVVACEPQSLKHTKQFERASFLAADLKASFGRGRLSGEQVRRWQSMKTDSPN